jgi:CheY-like chemotaxis protein
MQDHELVKPVDILLVEDNPGDVDLAREALEGSKMKNHLHAVQDGIEAMAFLKKTGAYAQMPRPDLILLDLNLPRMDGREVLHEIKSDDDFKRIPVVILTTSKDEEDVLRSYNLHANCYITKPIDLGQFLKVVRSIEDFWLSIVVLPPNGAIQCQPI